MNFWTDLWSIKNKEVFQIRLIDLPVWEVFDSLIVPVWSLKNNELFRVGLASSLKNSKVFHVGPKYFV